MKLSFVSLMSPVSDPVVDAIVAGASSRGVDIVRHHLTEAEVERPDIESIITVGWVCGLQHAAWRAGGIGQLRAIGAPVMMPSRYRGRPVYFGDIIVRSDSAVRGFADLRGAAFAYNEVESLSGYGMMRTELMRRGLRRKWLGSGTATGSHLASIAAVEAGSIECAVIDSTILDMLELDSDKDPAVRVIMSLGPYPAPPFVVSRAVPERTRSGLASAFAEVAAGGALGAWGVDRIAEVDDAAYDPLVQMSAGR